MLERSLKGGAGVAGLVAVALLATCGGGETSYSASRFSECLQSRDAGPTNLAADDSSDERPSIRDELVREAREQNGAVRAFTNTEDPNASSISLLFFRGGSDARRAAQRVEDDIEAESQRQREKGLEPGSITSPEVKDNVVILDRPTEAQRRVLDECLDESVA